VWDWWWRSGGWWSSSRQLYLQPLQVSFGNCSAFLCPKGSVADPDPGSGMGKNPDPVSGIRDKHPGSATLPKGLTPPKDVNFMPLINCGIVWIFRFEETGKPFVCCGFERCLSQSEKGTYIASLKYMTHWEPTCNQNVVHFHVYFFSSVKRLLHKDVLELNLAIRYSNKQDSSEPSDKNYRYIDFCYPLLSQAG
jgi:hypothetical protein